MNVIIAFWCYCEAWFIWELYHIIIGNVKCKRLRIQLTGKQKIGDANFSLGVYEYIGKSKPIQTDPKDYTGRLVYMKTSKLPDNSIAFLFQCELTSWIGMVFIYFFDKMSSKILT